MKINNFKIAANMNEYDFYYLGVYISKVLVSKTQIAEVCCKLNEIKHQLFQEKEILKIHSEKCITGVIPFLTKPNIYLFCSVDKEVYLGLYNKDCNTFVPITFELATKIQDILIYKLAYLLNQTAKRISAGLIKETLIQDEQMIIAWKEYLNKVKIHPNNFQHTYQVCFTCNLGKIITSDEELRQAIKRKELLIREEKEEVESRE